MLKFSIHLNKPVFVMIKGTQVLISKTNTDVNANVNLNVKIKIY